MDERVSQLLAAWTNHDRSARERLMPLVYEASRKAYEEFLLLWKDADPDLPILIEARREFAALKP